MIVGIGVDIVDLERLGRALMRAPRLEERLFTPEERGLPISSLAARFAAKEAVAKALRSPGNLSWQDVSVAREVGCAPVIRVHGTVRDRAVELGVSSWHLSLSHDGGMAIAMVVAEG